jgi:predicted peptidase
VPPRRLLLSVLLLSVTSVALAGEPKRLRFEGQVESALALDDLLYLPDGYDAATAAIADTTGTTGTGDRRWPLILFLHGSGGYGRAPADRNTASASEGLAAVEKGGLPKIMAGGLQVPAIVVAPQATTWWDQHLGALAALLDEIERSYRVDPDRVYLTGLSAGGGGVWALLLREPERFAAAIPICGAGSRAGIQRLKDLPIWVFHGEQDEAQPLEESTRMVEAIRARGGEKVKLTVYPGVGHDAWTPAYNDPAVWEWLFAQRRTPPTPDGGETR